MSEGHLSEPHELPDEDVHVEGPRPAIARDLALLGLAVVVFQGAFVVATSAFGRVWPSINSTKVPLP